MENQEKIKSALLEAFCLDDLMDELLDYTKKELKTCNKSNVGAELYVFSNFKRCWAHIDREKLRQVFVNLLSNVIKFTDKGYIFFGFHTSASGDNINFLVDDTGFVMNKDIDVDFVVAHGLVETLGGKMEVEFMDDAGIAIRFNVECEPFEGS